MTACPLRVNMLLVKHHGCPATLLLLVVGLFTRAIDVTCAVLRCLFCPVSAHVHGRELKPPHGGGRLRGEAKASKKGVAPGPGVLLVDSRVKTRRQLDRRKQGSVQPQEPVQVECEGQTSQWSSKHNKQTTD